MNIKPAQNLHEPGKDLRHVYQHLQKLVRVPIPQATSTVRVVSIHVRCLSKYSYIGVCIGQIEYTKFTLVMFVWCSHLLHNLRWRLDWRTWWLGRSVKGDAQRELLPLQNSKKQFRKTKECDRSKDPQHVVVLAFCFSIVWRHDAKCEQQSATCKTRNAKHDIVVYLKCAARERNIVKA